MKRYVHLYMLWLMGLSGLIAGGIATGVQAAEIDVACNTADLKAAIETVNTNRQDDILNLAAGCTYMLTWPLELDYDYIEETNTPTSLTIRGNGATLDGSHRATTLRAYNHELSIENLTIANSNSELAGPSNDEAGGASFALQQLTLTNVTMTGNYAAAGAGARIDANIATLTNVTVTNNTAFREGGGLLFSGGNATIINSVITNNQSYGLGGGILIESNANVTIMNTTIQNNTATVGGGIHVGELFGSNVNSILAIDGTTIANNMASVAGGIQIGGQTTLTNTTIAHNDGGGIAGEGELTLTSSTVANNNGGYGGVSPPDWSAITISSTILAGNTTSLFPHRNSDLMSLYGASVESLGNNLIGDVMNVQLTGATSNDIYGVNARLGPLQNNGGATLTMLPLADSPALDAGSCTGTADQRGQPRTVDLVDVSGTGCDIGAVEVQALAPGSANDAYMTAVDTPLTVGAVGGVLANDVTPSGSTTTVMVQVQPTQGTLTLNSDGSFTYTPGNGFNGLDTFTYTASNLTGTSLPATVTVAVGAVAPVSTNDGYATPVNQTLTVDVSTDGVLANDTDYNGDSITAAVLINPVNGAVNLNADGTFVYTPNIGYNGLDTFTYAASDVGLTGTPATVVILVGDPVPVATDKIVYGYDYGANGQLSPGNYFYDSNGVNNIQYEIVTPPQHADQFQLDPNADGGWWNWFQDLAEGNYVSEDSFTYRYIVDGQTSNTATIQIRLAQPSVWAEYDEYIIDTEGPFVVSAADGVLANDFSEHPDRQPLYAELLSEPQHGELIFNADGSFIYEPDPTYTGGDGFTYAIFDGVMYSIEPGYVGFDVFGSAPINRSVTGSGTQLTFNWEVPLRGSGPFIQHYQFEWFNLVLLQGTTPIYDEWFSLPSICDGEYVCAVTPEHNLADGEYFWKVRGWGQAESFGVFSRLDTVRINQSNLPYPEVISKVQPQAEELVEVGSVEFQWEPDPNATAYNLVITSPNGYSIDRWHSTADACNLIVCRASYDLPNGTFDWNIAGFGPGGMGNWGNPNTSLVRFYVGQLPPSSVQQLTPSIGQSLTEVDGGVVLTWQADPLAEWYRMYVGGPDGFAHDKWYEGAAVCVDDVCSVDEPLLLTSGGYSWWMQAWGPGGFGPWNSGTLFTVAVPGPGVITRTGPDGPVTDAHFDLTWLHDPNALWYHLYIAGGSGISLVQWLNAADYCDATTCTYPNPSLTNGNYEWWIQAWGLGGYGDWDFSSASFSVSIGAPGAVVRIAPLDSATVTGDNVAVQWTRSDEANWYHVAITQNAEIAHDGWYNAADVCVDTVCSASIPISAGVHEWWLGSWGPGGMGPYDSTTFTVQP